MLRERDHSTRDRIPRRSHLPNWGGYGELQHRSDCLFLQIIPAGRVRRQLRAVRCGWLFAEQTENAGGREDEAQNPKEDEN